jgi:hypothetical protein
MSIEIKLPRHRLVALCALLCTMGLATSAEAKSFQRKLAKGDSIEKLAKSFYGTEESAVYIRLASGLEPFGNKKAKPGTVVTIPTSWTYRIQKDDTWKALGRDYLGRAKRGRVLARYNHKKPSSPPPAGHLITIPAQATFRPKRTRSVAWLVKKLLPRKAPRKLRIKLAKLIVAYNSLRRPRVRKGRKATVPLFHLRVQDSLLPTEPPVPDPGARRRLARLRRKVAKLQRKGHFEKAAAVALNGGRWAERAPAAGARLYVDLVVSYVALGRKVLARAAARRAYQLDPDLTLNPRTTSPKVIAVFKKARASNPGGKR